MRRRLPHDVTNALAASALVLETGLATADAIAEALATFQAPPHRLEPVGQARGRQLVQRLEGHHAPCRFGGDPRLRFARADRRWQPQGRRPVADGRRSRIACAPLSPSARRPPTSMACSTSHDRSSMPDRWRRRSTAPPSLARPGDAVVLSPGCASFDWYSGYPARGEDFRRLVEAHIAAVRNTDPSTRPVRPADDDHDHRPAATRRATTPAESKANEVRARRDAALERLNGGQPRQAEATVSQAAPVGGRAARWRAPSRRVVPCSAASRSRSSNSVRRPPSTTRSS